MKLFVVFDWLSWLLLLVWFWQFYLLSYYQGGIVVIDIGDGLVVLFVYVGSWSFVWCDVLLCLVNDFWCVVIDVLGCGFSDWFLILLIFVQVVDVIILVIDVLQLCDFILVVYDLGGLVGFLVVVCCGDCVVVLVVVNCFVWWFMGLLFWGMFVVMGSVFVCELDVVINVFVCVMLMWFGVGWYWSCVDCVVFWVGIDVLVCRVWYVYFCDVCCVYVFYIDVDVVLWGGLVDWLLLIIFGQFNDLLWFQLCWKELFLMVC